MEVANKYVSLKTHIEGAPKESDFELKTSPLALSLDPGSDEIIVKNLYVSIDPYQLNRMKLYNSSQKMGAGLEGITLGKVSVTCSQQLNIRVEDNHANVMGIRKKGIGFSLIFVFKSVCRKLRHMVWQKLWLQTMLNLRRVMWLWDLLLGRSTVR